MRIKPFAVFGDAFSIPAGQKFPPMAEGVTGEFADSKMRPKEVQAHIDSGGNWGVHLNDSFIVVDIDAYKSEEAYEEAMRQRKRYGVTNDTLRVSSRFDECPISGHYYYRLPKSHAKNLAKGRRFRAVLPHNGIPWGDVVHRRHRYPVMPGSRVRKKYNGNNKPYRVLDSRYLDDPSLIPKIPKKLYEALLKPAVEVIRPVDGVYPEADIAKMRNQVEYSLLQFKMAKEGIRDTTHFQACMDIGKLARMGYSKKKIEKFKNRILKYGEANRADAATMRKTNEHIAKGKREGKIEFLIDTFWYRRDGLMDVYRRSLDAGVSPWAVLMVDLVLLAHATDHRIVLDTGQGHIASPINLYLGMVGKSGRFKSSTIRRTMARWELPALDLPPVPETGYYGLDYDQSHTPFTASAARRPFIDEPVQAKTAQGVLKAFLTKNPDTKLTSKTVYRMLVFHDEPNFIAGFGRQNKDKEELKSLLQTMYYSQGYRHGTAMDITKYFLGDNTYSLQYIVGIQPKRMDEFLELQGDGILERMLFCSGNFDVEEAERFNDLTPDFNPVYPKIAPWGVPKPKKKSKKGVKSKKAVLVFSEAVQAEIREFNFWRANHPRYDFSDLFTSKDLAAHGDVKMARLAAMLYRHDGGKLTGRVTTIPDSYWHEAKELIKHSTEQLNDALFAKASKAAFAKAERRAEEVKTAVAKQEALELPEADLERRLKDGDFKWWSFQQYWRTKQPFGTYNSHASTEAILEYLDKTEKFDIEVSGKGRGRRVRVTLKKGK